MIYSQDNQMYSKTPFLLLVPKSLSSIAVSDIAQRISRERYGGGRISVPVRDVVEELKRREIEVEILKQLPDDLKIEAAVEVVQGPTGNY